MRMRVLLTGLATILQVAFLSACGESNQESELAERSRTEAPPWINTPEHYDTLSMNPASLAGGYESDTALFRAAFLALAAQDTTELMEMIVSTPEFDSIVYPELGKHLPAARDNRPEARDLLRSQDQLNSAKNLQTAFRELGDGRYRFVEVTYDTILTYVSYDLLERPTVVATSPAGDSVQMSLFGSIISKDGVYKTLSWRDPEVSGLQ